MLVSLARMFPNVAPNLLCMDVEQTCNLSLRNAFVKHCPHLSNLGIRESLVDIATRPHRDPLPSQNIQDTSDGVPVLIGQIV